MRFLHKTLFFDRNFVEESVEFKFPIAQIIPLDELIIIRFRIDPPDVNNTNVIAVNSAGKPIWTVENLKTVYEDSPYTNMSFSEATLILNNWDGSNVAVNPNNGKILYVSHEK